MSPVHRTVLALVLAAAPAAAAAAEGHAEAIAALLEPPPPPAQVERCAAALAELGPAAVPDLLRALDRPPEGAPAGERAVRDAALIAALAGLPPAAVRAGLEALAAPPPREIRPETAFRVIEVVGREPELALLLAVAAPDQPGGALPRARAAAVERALGAVLARDPEAVWSLRSHFAQAEEALLAPIARAVAKVGGRDALQVLASLLGSRPAADPFLLSLVGGIAEDVPRPVPDEARRAVRFLLRAQDPHVQLAAVVCSGRAGDEDAVPELVRLLAAGAGPVRRAAEEALRAITGLALGRDVDAWERWYDAELLWWQRDSAARLAQLRARDPGEVIAAIRDLAGRRLHRGELARALLPLLERGEPEVVELACVTLGHLGEPLARSALRRAAARQDERVRAAAERALEAIARRGLPAEPEDEGDPRTP